MPNDQQHKQCKNRLKLMISEIIVRKSEEGTFAEYPRNYLRDLVCV